MDYEHHAPLSYMLMRSHVGTPSFASLKNWAKNLLSTQQNRRRKICSEWCCSMKNLCDVEIHFKIMAQVDLDQCKVINMFYQRESKILYLLLFYRNLINI